MRATAWIIQESLLGEALCHHERNLGFVKKRRSKEDGLGKKITVPATPFTLLSVP